MRATACLSMPMMRAWHAGRRVSRTLALNPRLGLELMTWRVALPILKRIVRTERLAHLMWSPADAVDDVVERQRRVGAIKRIASEGGRLLVSRNCLERSLVLYRLFSRAGAAPDLVLAVRRGQRRVDGHAWVEIDGRPIGEPEADTYVPILRFNSPPR